MTALRDCTQWCTLCAEKLILSDQNVGAGARKFWRVRRIFAGISSNLLCDFFLQIFSHKDYQDLFSGVTSKKRNVFTCFSANVGRHFLKANNVASPFCPDFQGFWPDFQGLFPDIRQIKKLEVLFHPLHPRFLRHWIKTSVALLRVLTSASFHMYCTPTQFGGTHFSALALTLKR